jgi:hypothetical protein
MTVHQLPYSVWLLAPTTRRYDRHSGLRVFGKPSNPKISVILARGPQAWPFPSAGAPLEQRWLIARAAQETAVANRPAR